MGLEGLSKRRVVAAGAIIGPEHVPQYKETTLTNAQVLALRATPISVAPAPGKANVLRLFSHAVLVVNASAGAYTETADNLAIRQTNTTGVLMSDAIETTGFLTVAAIKANTTRRAVDTIGALLNQALVLHNTGDGELGGGNAANTLRIRCYYLDIALPGWGTLA